MKQLKPRFYTDDQKDLPYNLLDEHMPAMEEATREMDPMTSVMSSMDRSPSSIDPRSAGLIADVVSAGLPALSATISGASPSIQSRQFQRADQYAKTRGDALVPSKNNLATLENDQGEPYYELFDNSLGMKPYLKSSVASSLARNNPAGVVQSTVKAYDPETGKSKVMALMKDGTLRDLETEGWGGYGEFTSEDIMGSKRKTVFPKNDPSIKSPAGYEPGFGTKTGVPEETRKATDKLIEKYGKEVEDIKVKKFELDNALNIMSKPNPGPREMAAASEALIRATTAETRLTDEDVRRVSGSDFTSLFQKVKSYSSMAAMGNLTEFQRQDFLNAAKTLSDRFKRMDEMYQQKLRTGTAALPGSKQYLDAQGYQEPKKKDIDWKNRLKGLK